MVPLRLTGSAWSAFTCVSLMLILTSLQASIIVSSSLSSYIVSGMPENSMQLRRLYYSSFGIWISRLLDFFLRLQDAVFWMTKSLFNISFLDKSWFAVSVNSFIWQQRLFISSPTITLSFKSMVFFTISAFFKAFIALLVMSNRFVPSAILLDSENRELKTNQNMCFLLDTSSLYGCTHEMKRPLNFHQFYVFVMQNKSVESTEIYSNYI